MNRVTACLGLGSNLDSARGDRAASLRAARAMLARTPGVEAIASSAIYETSPVGEIPQGPYLNAALSLRTTLGAEALLARMLEIERSLGRDRTREERWGPRVIDLDLLLYGDAVINEPSLRVPHPRLSERLFVLVPLAEVAGAMAVGGKTVSELLAAARVAHADTVERWGDW